MPFSNLNSRHFTAAEEANINSLISQLEAALDGHLPVLTPKERQTYGSIHEKAKLFVNKVNDLYDSQPELACPEVEWAEFKNDFRSRIFKDSIMMRFTKMNTGLDNGMILHDFDNWQDGLKDYGFSQYSFGMGKPGFEDKVKQLKQFFTGGPKAEPKPEDDTKHDEIVKK